MEEYKTKNKIISQMNDISFQISSLEKVTNYLGRRNLSDITRIYLNKIYDLEELFECNNKDFYKEVVGQSILKYMDYFLVKPLDILVSITNCYSQLGKSDSFVSMLTKKRLIKLISIYEKICLDFENLLLKDIFVEAIFRYFNTLQYTLFKPGEIFNKYLCFKEELKQFNIDFDVIDNKVMPIVKKQERVLKRFYEKLSKKFGNYENVNKYIKEVVFEVKQENANNKQR